MLFTPVFTDVNRWCAKWNHHYFVGHLILISLCGNKPQRCERLPSIILLSIKRRTRRKSNQLFATAAKVLHLFTYGFFCDSVAGRQGELALRDAASQYGGKIGCGLCGHTPAYSRIKKCVQTTEVRRDTG